MMMRRSLVIATYYISFGPFVGPYITGLTDGNYNDFGCISIELSRNFAEARPPHANGTFNRIDFEK